MGAATAMTVSASGDAELMPLRGPPGIIAVSSSSSEAKARA